jgi:hypothetical protein
VASCLSSLGALVYAAGYFLHVGWTESPWLMVTGALLNFVALVMMTADGGVCRGRRDVVAVLLVFCFGMLIDAMMGLFAANPPLFLPDYIGRDDEVRPRMLRLARAAAIALPMLTFLYHGLATRQRSAVGVIRWGGIAMMFGAIGMPLILTAAALTTVHLKLLLGLPAHATFLGTLVGVWLAHRAARPLELWGWLIVALSMAIGLLMGIYAFDGPLPSPEFMGEYNDYPRRLWRLAHAYCIVLGLLSIFLARELDRARPVALFTRVGTAMLVGGSVCTVLVLVLAATVELPAPILGIGPAAVAVGLVLCLSARGESIPRDRESPA